MAKVLNPHMQAAIGALERELTMRIRGISVLEWQYREPTELLQLIDQVLSDSRACCSEEQRRTWYGLRSAALTADTAKRAGIEVGTRRAEQAAQHGIPISFNEVLQSGRRLAGTHYLSSGELSWFVVGWMTGWMSVPNAVAEEQAQATIGATGTRIYSQQAEQELRKAS